MISSTLTFLTLAVSIYHIYMHLSNFNNPFFQSKIIVIMIMAPFYCITSMGSFIFPVHSALFRISKHISRSPGIFTRLFCYLLSSTSSFPIWLMTEKRIKWRIKKYTSSWLLTKNKYRIFSPLTTAKSLTNSLIGKKQSILLTDAKSMYYSF